MKIEFEYLAGCGHLRKTNPARATRVQSKYEGQLWRHMLLGQAVALASDVPFSPSVITVIYNALVDIYDNLLLQHEWEKRQRPLLSQQPILRAIVRHTQWSNLREGNSGFLLHNIKESPIGHFST